MHGPLDDRRPTLQAQLTLSDQLIEELKQADTLVLGAPMYNFGISASLKQWVDAALSASLSNGLSGAA